MNHNMNTDGKTSQTGNFSKLTWQKKLLGADITHAEFHVLITVCAYANADGTNAFPGLDRIVAEAKVSRSCAVKCLKALESKGWLRATRRSTGRGNATVYRLSTPRRSDTVGKAQDEGERETVERPRKRVLSEAETVLSESQTVLSENHTRSLPDPLPGQEKTPSSATKPTPELLPENWEPNGTHRHWAGKLGYTEQGLSDLAGTFVATNTDKRSTNWDRAFGGLINSYHEDPARAEIDYELEPLEDSYV